jgi:hypothetical protein
MSELTPRLNLLVSIFARVALIVIALQLTALDHHFSAADVVGIERSSAHTLHCHDGAASCADGGSGAVLAVQDVFFLPTELTSALALGSHGLKPQAVSSPSEFKPPRL